MKTLFLKWANNTDWYEVDNVDVRCIMDLTEKIDDKDNKHLVEHGEIYFDDDIASFDNDNNDDDDISSFDNDDDDNGNETKYKISKIKVKNSTKYIYVLLLIECVSCEFNDYITKMDWFEDRNETVGEAMEWFETEVEWDFYDESNKKLMSNFKKHLAKNDGAEFIGVESRNTIAIFKVPIPKDKDSNTE